VRPRLQGNLSRTSARRPRRLRDGRTRFMVATDIEAGASMWPISHVINYDIPQYDGRLHPPHREDGARGKTATPSPSSAARMKPWSGASRHVLGERIERRLLKDSITEVRAAKMSVCPSAPGAPGRRPRRHRKGRPENACAHDARTRRDLSGFRTGRRAHRAGLRRIPPRRHSLGKPTGG